MGDDLSQPVEKWPDAQLAHLARSGADRSIWNVRRALAAEVLRLRAFIRDELRKPPDD
jgi:hypothetical protein